MTVNVLAVNSFTSLYHSQIIITFTVLHKTSLVSHTLIRINYNHNLLVTV